MRPSGIGGQAVIEGIMMRNNSTDKYSIAVRKPGGDIELVVRDYKNLSKKHKTLALPIIRGVFNFIDSLVIGMSTLSYSAEFYEDPQEQAPTAVDKIAKKLFRDKLDTIIMAGTIIFSIVLAVLLFMMAPYVVSRYFTKYIVSETILNLIEGGIRLLIFLLYVMAISLMQDIKRVYMYHGAEHKCINCIENGKELNVKNVRESSRIHKRCGTSFMFLVMFVSIVFFIFIRFESRLMQIAFRIILVPVIAGVSYEILRLAGRKDNLFINIISAPGMLMQRITTKEPDDDMIEVAITAVEAVFDWRKFREEYDEKDVIHFVVEDSEEIPEFIESRSRRQTEKKMKELLKEQESKKK